MPGFTTAGSSPYVSRYCALHTISRSSGPNMHNPCDMWLSAWSKRSNWRRSSSSMRLRSVTSSHSVTQPPSCIGWLWMTYSRPCMRWFNWYG